MNATIFTNSQLVKEMKDLLIKVAQLNEITHHEIKNSQFWGGHHWSHSYYMGTLGNKSKETVEKYIKNQYRNSSPD